MIIKMKLRTYHPKDGDDILRVPKGIGANHEEHSVSQNASAGASDGCPNICPQSPVKVYIDMSVSGRNVPQNDIVPTLHA